MNTGRVFAVAWLAASSVWVACGGPSVGGAPPVGTAGAGTGAHPGDASVGPGAGGQLAQGGGTGAGGSAPGTAGGAQGAGGNSQGPLDAAITYPNVTFTYEPPPPTVGLGDAACASATVTQTLGKVPADIIFLVDNSGSMQVESGFVATNLRNFSTQIIQSGIDVHVVLISSYPGTGWGMCIDPPLGVGGCPATDTNLPGFLHINREVGSRDGLDVLIQEYPQWQGMLRPNSTKHIVIITDDQSNLDGASFNTRFLALNPTLAGYKFHGIYSYTAPDIFSCLAGGGDVCCGLAAAEGTVYRSLVASTGGVQGNLCTQDFGPVFTALSESVITGSGFLCDIPMPRSSSGIIDPTQVELLLKWTDAGPKSTSIQKISGLGACTPQAGGWYYDNEQSPTTISLCQGTCDAAKAVTDPKLDVLLGCLGS